MSFVAGDRPDSPSCFQFQRGGATRPSPVAEQLFSGAGAAQPRQRSSIAWPPSAAASKATSEDPLLRQAFGCDLVPYMRARPPRCAECMPSRGVLAGLDPNRPGCAGPNHHFVPARMQKDFIAVSRLWARSRGALTSRNRFAGGDGDGCRRPTPLGNPSMAAAPHRMPSAVSQFPGPLRSCRRVRVQ